MYNICESSRAQVLKKVASKAGYLSCKLERKSCTCYFSSTMLSRPRYSRPGIPDIAAESATEVTWFFNCVRILRKRYPDLLPNLRERFRCTSTKPHMHIYTTNNCPFPGIPITPEGVKFRVLFKFGERQVPRKTEEGLKWVIMATWLMMQVAMVARYGVTTPRIATIKMTWISGSASLMFMKTWVMALRQWGGW